MGATKLTGVMRSRLEEVGKGRSAKRGAPAEPGVYHQEQPNWAHMTDKALQRRGLVFIERVLCWWCIRLTDAGRALLSTEQS